MRQNDEQIVISGVGVITCFGVGIDPLWDEMVEGRTGLRRIERFDPSGFTSQVAGELADDAFKVKKIVPKSHRKATKVMCRDTELAVGAAAQAVESAGLITAGTSDEPPTIAPDRVGCHIGAGLISAEVNELAAALVTSKKEDGTFDLAHWGGEGMQNLTPLWLLKYLPNMLACHVTIVHDCQGPSNAITCCEASSGLSIAESRRVIQRGDADACLSGGAEDRINPLALYRQHCTGRLADSDGSGDMSSLVQPYSDNATGTVIGEGGAVMIVESKTSCDARNGSPWCTIDGVGCRQSFADSPLDADPAAIASAINRALEEAQCQTTDIDVIVPLGSGVKQVDNAERAGLTEVFGEAILTIPTITTIPFTGNCMAGNGGIAIGVAAKAIQEQKIPARLGAKTTDGIDAGRCDAQEKEINRILVVTASEGGQCVAIVLGRITS
ncbi:MAG: beta-ketoacyl synthase N-terminal-like domain-containing protein [Phycisphaerales bacterium]|jgi:3-oxoacyl-[acyl-carrier-protein] synthase II|nr:beta-ketoacyl synthase N-terminal-like domain-containing protein [Phycisphaerales bacterium]